MEKGNVRFRFNAPVHRLAVVKPHAPSIFCRSRPADPVVKRSSQATLDQSGPENIDRILLYCIMISVAKAVPSS
jgi:hypothetical protein